MNEQYKKFGELTREEQLDLVNHVLDGGEVEILSNTLWNNTKMSKSGVVCFHNNYCYRKFKSELDLLKEQRRELNEKIKKLRGDISVGDTVINKLDASKKEYKVLRSYLYKDLFVIGRAFYSEDTANDQFIKV